MWIVIFGLVCFWSSAAALIAHLFGWPVIPVTLLTGMMAGVVLVFVASVCQTAGKRSTEEQAIHIQTDFGGTFK